MFILQNITNALSSFPIYTLYVIVVWGSLFLGYLLLKRFIHNSEKKRIARVKEGSPGEAVKTDLTQITEESTLKSGKKGIAQRFSVIRVSAISFLVIVAIILTLLPHWNSLPTQFISIIATVATVMIGIAAKPVIENVFAGIVMTLSRQFRTGDTVMIDDEYGTIEDISSTHTTIKIWDWRRYVIPNSLMLTKECVNYTLTDSNIWAYVEFWTIPEADFDVVERLAKQAVQECSLLWEVEEPQFWIMDIEKEAVKCWVAGWASSPQDAWVLKHQIRKNVLQLLGAEGIVSHRNVLTITPNSIFKKKH
ncbi:MAG: mechanosensitive ion channel domain-containing protein [Patescibacteria group bacterium]